MTSRLAKLAATALGWAVIAPAVVATGALAQTTPAPTTAPAPTAAPPPTDLDFFGRLVKAYTDEMGQAPAPAANAPPGNRAAPYPPQPVTSPPYPFTVWPYGGTNPVGATTPNSIDSPFMTALRPRHSASFSPTTTRRSTAG